MEELKKWIIIEKESYNQKKLSAQQNKNDSALLKAEAFIEAFEKTLQKINEIENSNNNSTKK